MTDQAGHLIEHAFRYDAMLWVRSLGRERRFRDELLGLARIAPGEDVVDVGCGTGTLAIAAKRRVGNGTVCGVEPSPPMLARARAKVRRARVDVDLTPGSAQALPFDGDAFDVVLCSLVLHQIPADARAQCIREIARVLRRGGRALVVDIDPDHPENPRRTPHAHAHRHGHRLFDVDDVVPLLEQSGLRVVGEGTVAFRFAALERMRYVLAAA